MSLPPLNLDNQTFAQLMEDARKLIPRYAPQWTDYNTHDPGITFIELFAWLTELQRYYLDQPRDENFLKFLKLLGIRLKDVASATTDTTFSFTDQKAKVPIWVPQGTKLITQDQVVFETDTPLLVVPVTLEKIISSSAIGRKDNIDTNRQSELSFFAFGENAEAGSYLYLGFNQPFPPKQPIGLTFNLFEDYPVDRGRYGEEAVKIIPSATLVWEYYSVDRQWQNLQVEHDETVMLSLSGRLWLTAPSDMYVRNIFPFPEQLYWLRATIQQAGYELPPKIDSILLNTISVTQKNTLSEIKTYSSNHQPTQSFPDSYLVIKGNNIIQVQQFDLTLEILIFRSHLQPIPIIWWLGVILSRNQEIERPDKCWQDWDNYTLEKSEAEAIITVTFHRKIPPKGTNNIRLISYLSDFEHQRLLGRSNGLPEQTFSLKLLPVIPNSLKIQVKEKIQQYDLWRDWIRVDNFDSSEPENPHYVLNADTGEIYFGDGMNGEIPQVAEHQYEHNIRVVSYQISNAERGNVDAKAINNILNPISTLLQQESVLATRLKVENPQAASGGISQEMLQKGQLRARKDLKQISQAVTSEDFEGLALSTPGLRVARAKAISVPTVPTLVQVIIVPYNEGLKPAKPSQGFLQTVSRHLEQHRLITTQLQVIPPSYVEVSVKAIVHILSGFEADDIHNKVEKTLIDGFLHPLNGGTEGRGWIFGRTVYTSEVYKAIEDNVLGVDYVENLELAIEDADQDAKAFVDREGNIQISPQSLIYSRQNQIEILSSKKSLFSHSGDKKT